MVGWVIGSVIGLLVLALAFRRARHRRCGHGHGRGRFGRGARALRHLFRRLETTPGQERTILEAVNGVRDTVVSSRGTFLESRDELARAIGGDVFDEGALFAAFQKHDKALASIRGEVGEQLARIHEVLTTEQRVKLAELLAKGFRGPFGFHSSGPNPAV